MRLDLSQSLFVFATFVIISVATSCPLFAADHRESPLIWGLAESQFYRVCINVLAASPRNQGGSFETEIVSMDLVGTVPRQGVASFLTQSFEIPSGEFRCFDYSHSRLAEALRLAGGEADPTTGALTFRMDMYRARKGANVIRATAMNINALDGKIELHSTIGVRTPVIDD